MPNNVGTIAQAYVQILPSTEGIQGSLTNLLGGEADSAGKSAGGKFAGAFGTAAKALAGAAVAGFTAAAAGAVSLGKQALESYADYEQLTGGIETLFKSSSDTVMQYAAEAYKTAGLSANEYMETVTGFSASLIQSTGRGAQQDLDALKASLDEQYDAVKRHWQERIRLTKDSNAKASLRYQMEDELKALKKHNEEALKQAEAMNMASESTPQSLAKAAELANMAITDMSDNANKLGNSMESIQNAYQGFAKQNFSMLDNLQLGYGGKNEEMERLLADAEALSGIHYDMSSYADVVEAIHVIQTEMGITGTTAKEAATTISGSLAMTKASWANLVTGIADDNADIDKLIDDFINSALTYADNVLPRIGTILEGGGKLLKEGAAKLLPVVIDTLIEAAPDLAEAGVQLIITLAKSLILAVPKLYEATPEIIMALYNGFLAGTADIRAAGNELMEIIKTAVLEKVDAAKEWGRNLVTNFDENIRSGIETVRSTATELMESAKEAIMEKVDAAREWGRNLVTNFDENIRSGIETVRSTATELMENAKDAIMEKVEAAKDWGRDLISNFVTGIKNGWAELKGNLGKLAEKIADYIGFSEPKVGPLSNFHTYAPDMMKLFAEGIRDNEDLVTQQLIRSFDLRPVIEQAAADEAPGQIAAAGDGGQIINLTALVQLDGAVLARKMYRFNQNEIQRHGESLVLA